MVEKKLQCLVCQKRVANAANVLARHLRTAHDIEWVDYVVQYEHAGEWPKCACGCGERLVWRKGGFGKYVKGHDNQGSQNSRASVTEIAGPGWIINPFTGREERVVDDAEIAFLNHCIRAQDPVTHDHGIRIGWEDSSGRIRILVPSFKHLKRELLMIIDDPGSTDFNRRLAGIKAWCHEHGFMALVLHWVSDGFQVVGASNGGGADAKEQG